MSETVFALIAIVAGLLFCFRGYLAFRLVIPLWGAFVGFSLGAGLGASLGDGGFLATGLSWGLGIAVGLLFALLAYLFYAVAVTIAMGSIGFALGTSLLAALGVEWTWLVVLAGLLLGLLLAYAAIASDLPMLLLVVLSALGGASAVVTGALLLTGALDRHDLDDGGAVARAGDDWWWYAAYVALALAGAIAQGRDAARRSETMRAAWAARGGA